MVNEVTVEGFENKVTNAISNNYFYKSSTAFYKNVILTKRAFTLLQLNVAGINNMNKFRRIKDMLLRDLKFKCDVIGRN